MAIQTFTSGQTLTAAQMTSLQANDYNQTVSTKTTSYTLVAADVGTRVVMNSASATTITVNTSIFAAGDTLFIQNIGAGVCTVTAGTCTVGTSGTLALVQNAGGTLYFTSASAAIFIASGVTASAGGMTLLSTTTLTGASTTVSSIDQTYTALQIYMFGAYSATASGYLRCYINSDSTNGNYFSSYQRYRGGTTQTQDDIFSFSGFQVLNSASNKVMNAVLLPNYAGSQSKAWSVIGSGITDNSGAGGWFGGGIWNSTTAISSLQFINSGGSWSAGTVLIYGVK